MGLLRVALALAVVVGHALPITSPNPRWNCNGSLAVQIFFIISGFYMSLVLTERYTPERNPNYRMDFYKARFVRLFPAYFVILVATAIYVAATVVAGHPGEHPVLAVYDWLPSAGGIGVAVVNVLMIGQDIPALLSVDASGHIDFLTGGHAADGQPWNGWLFVGDAMFIPQGWSIGLELWFYILAPWLVRRSTTTLIVLCLISLSLKYGMRWGANLNPYYFFPSQLSFFLFGMLAQRHGSRADNSTRGWLALVAVLTAIAAGPFVNGTAYNVAMYLLVSLSIAPLFQLTGQWKFDRAFGELSYPIYLAHMLVIWVLKAQMPSCSTPLFVTAAIAMTFAIALVMNYIVERPVERYRARFRRRSASAI